MKDRNINKVKVIKSFPGFDVSDVLILNKENGLFDYFYTDNETGKSNNDLISSINMIINEHKSSLSKDQILKDMEYFEDISDYEIKDKEWVLNRIEELKYYIKELDKDIIDDIVSNSVNIKESKTVWQNMIWEYETFLGMRKLIN